MKSCSSLFLSLQLLLLLAVTYLSGNNQVVAFFELGEEPVEWDETSLLDDVTKKLRSRIQKLFDDKIKTPQCREQVTKHFRKYVDAIAREQPLPFSETFIKNECPEDVLDYNNLPTNVTIATLMNRRYQPSKSESGSSSSLYIDKPGNLNLLYGILMHGNPVSTMRLIDVLYDKKNDNNGEGNGNTLFVIHVDGKEENDEAFDKLVEYSIDKDYVHIVPTEFRIRVNWGGFSMVQATLNILKYSFALLPQGFTSTQLPKDPLEFHKFIHIASSTYPIKSNSQIRSTIAAYPLDANLVQIAMKPIEPHPAAWQYFVECDDVVHRIYRLHPLSNKAGNGIDLYMGSQWFIISNEFALYLANAKRGSMVQQFIEYAKHIIIADEGFFSTVLRHSRFCTKHHNANFLHLHFDRWESDLESIDRDERKCLMPDPDKCGRSPTILTKDYLFALEMTDDLFARKFSNEEHSELKDILDMKRAQEEAKIRDLAVGNYTEKPPTVNTSFEGYGSLIVAKETIHDHDPLCVGLGQTGNQVQLVSCFHDHVLSTLAKDWATGAVIEEEVLPNNQWEVGPCSSDGELKRNYDTAQMTMTKGIFSPAGPHCMIKQFGGPRRGRCIDIEGERVEPGGRLQVFPCMNQWHQMFGFGDNDIARNGTIFGSVPKHIVNALQYKGKDQPPYLCFGVIRRGETEYTPWKEDEKRENFDTATFVSERVNKMKMAQKDVLIPLRLWKNKQLVTIPCSDESAVVDFLFVPFIVENLTEEEVVQDKTGKDTKEDIEDKDTFEDSTSGFFDEL